MKGRQMELEKKTTILENTYAAVLAEAVTIFTKFGILDKVTAIKAQNAAKSAKMQVNSFGIRSPEDVFQNLARVFNCANWQIEYCEQGFTAKATACKLCGLTKRMGGDSPCDIYCLNPMKSMVKVIAPEKQFVVESTLWEHDCCEVKVIE